MVYDDDGDMSERRRGYLRLGSNQLIRTERSGNNESVSLVCGRGYRRNVDEPWRSENNQKRGQSLVRRYF